MSNRIISKATAESTNESVDLKPFINFLVVLIPVLMLSAEFSKTSVNKLDIYKKGGNTDSTTITQPVITNNLKLTVFVSDTALTVASNYGFLPSLRYKEYAQYIQKNNRKNSSIVPHTEAERSNALQNGYELSDLLLYSLNDKEDVDQACYYKGKLLIDNEKMPVSKITDGMDLYFVDDPNIKLYNVSMKNIEQKPLSAYDNLECLLLQTHLRYSESVADGNSIIIASDDKVIYDKIIQLMDVSKASGFTDISIAKIRT